MHRILIALSEECECKVRKSTERSWRRQGSCGNSEISIIKNGQQTPFLSNNNNNKIGVKFFMWKTLLLLDEQLYSLKSPRLSMGS